jgi:HPr kinase/phosphorylase
MTERRDITPTGGPETVTVHGSAVALRDYGVLITGDSGSGKTSLAVELLSLGAELVADDWVRVERAPAGGLVMSPPEPIAGLMELRGIGMVRLPHADQAPLLAVVDMNREPGARLPETEARRLLGMRFPVICGRGRDRLAPAIYAVMRGGGLVEPGPEPGR